MIDYNALFKVSYGLYIVCSGSREYGNAYISNTVFQVTAEPPRFATCCNKENHTAGLIQSTGLFSVSVLQEEAGAGIIGTFGFKSGNSTDKLKGMKLQYGETGVPIVLNDTIAYLEFRVCETVDVGTHLMFIGELVHSRVLDDKKDPLTYLHYRKVKKGMAPKNAPTYIDKAKLEKSPGQESPARYECPACGYIYDEKAEGVKFDDLPDNWVCPVCGEEKSEFIKV
ncbi:MAG: flavin reductase [Bacteroidales bacterium]|nr:flavin reductase [Bacteroidales bacterium]